MKYDELAFFNQQLAAMLRDGMPLEGALRRLCEDMRAGPLRSELQALEAELAKGTPMADALQARQLPELYKRMILVGVKSGDLPGALTMLAPFYFMFVFATHSRTEIFSLPPPLFFGDDFLFSRCRRSGG